MSGRGQRMRIEITMSLPRETASVPLVRRTVATALKNAGVTAECIDEVADFAGVRGPATSPSCRCSSRRPVTSEWKASSSGISGCMRYTATNSSVSEYGAAW